MEKSFAWQCICGYIEYQEALPEDCPKCFRVGEFSKIPDDMLEETEAEKILSLTQSEYEEDFADED